MLVDASSPIRIVDQKTVWKRFIHLQTLVLDLDPSDPAVWKRPIPRPEKENPLPAGLGRG